MSTLKDLPEILEKVNIWNSLSSDGKQKREAVINHPLFKDDPKYSPWLPKQNEDDFRYYDYAFGFSHGLNYRLKMKLLPPPSRSKSYSTVCSDHFPLVVTLEVILNIQVYTILLLLLYTIKNDQLLSRTPRFVYHVK